MLPAPRCCAVLLILFSTSAQGAPVPDDTIDARTPDGRTVRVKKETLKTFNQYDMNGDGYVDRKVICPRWLARLPACSDAVVGVRRNWSSIGWT